MSISKTLKSSIKHLADEHAVYIEAKHLREIGIDVKPQLGPDGDPKPVPDSRPVRITVAELREAMKPKPIAAPVATPDPNPVDATVSTENQVPTEVTPVDPGTEPPDVPDDPEGDHV